MSRLFYDPPRIAVAQGGNGKRPRLSSRQYVDKVASLIPAEVIAAYLAIMRYIPNIRFVNLHHYFYVTVFLLGIIGTYFYLRWASDKGKPRNVHIVISIIAFIVWAYDTTGDKIWPEIYDAAIGSIILVLFTFSSGKIPLD